MADHADSLEAGYQASQANVATPMDLESGYQAGQASKTNDLESGYQASKSTPTQALGQDYPALEPLTAYEPPSEQPPPGRTNDLSLQNVGMDLYDLKGYLQALGAGGLGLLSAATPSFIPGQPAGKGIDYGALGPQAEAFRKGLVNAGIGMAGYYPLKYGAPIAAGRPQDIITELKRRPLIGALDFLPGISPAMKGLEAVGKAAGLAQGAAKLVSTGQGAVQDFIQGAAEGKAQRLIDKTLQWTPAERAAQDLRYKNMMGAAAKIDPNLRPYLTVIAEQTDPALAPHIKDPAISNYLKLQDDYWRPLTNELLKRGHLSPEDLYAARIMPQYMAAVARGEEIVPASAHVNPKALTTADAYDPSIQAALRRFVGDRLNQDPDAFIGAYNPVTFQRAVEMHFGRRRTNSLLGKVSRVSTEKAIDLGGVTAKREEAALQKTRIKGKEVTGIRNPAQSRDTVRSAIAKMEQTEAFLAIFEKLQGLSAQAKKEGKAVEQAVGRKLLRQLMPLAHEAGIATDVIPAIDAIVHDISLDLNADGKSLVEEVRSFIRGDKALLHGELVRLYNLVGYAQRVSSVLGDAVMPFYIYLQDVMWFGGTVFRGPETWYNGLVAAVLATNPKILARLPREVLEYREPMFANAAHPLLRLLSKYNELGLKGVNQIRGAAYIAEMLNEMDRMPQRQRAFTLKALEAQLSLGAKARRLLGTQARLRGGNMKGVSLDRLRELERDTIEMIDNIYGKYTGEATELAKALNGIFLWGRMISHAMTLAGHLIQNNEYKLWGMLQVARAAKVWQEKNNANYPNLRSSVTAAGGWVLPRRAPDGSYIVQFDGGWNLLVQALDLSLRTMKLLGMVNLPEEDEEAGFPPLHLLWGGMMMLCGRMPTGERPIVNPYGAQIGRNAYDLVAEAKKREQGEKLNPITDAVGGVWNYREGPFSLYSAKEFTDEVLVTIGTAFDRKAWTYLKNLEGSVGNFRPSDKTVPGLPGFGYPKIDLRATKKFSGPAMYPTSVILGGSKLAPVTIRQETKGEEVYERQAARPVIKKHQRSDIDKLYEKTHQMQAARLKGLVSWP